MLRPSYSELMEILNEDRDLDSKITSRYTIVIAAAKRARQIVNGAPCNNSFVRTDKAVSIAISELEHSLIKLYPEGLPDMPAALEIEAPKQPPAYDAPSDLDLIGDDFDDLSGMEDFDSEDEFDGGLDDELFDGLDVEADIELDDELDEILNKTLDENI